jgi:hypothetical protein
LIKDEWCDRQDPDPSDRIGVNAFDGDDDEKKDDAFGYPAQFMAMNCRQCRAWVLLMLTNFMIVIS